MRPRTPPFPDGFNAKPEPYGVSFTGMACSEPRLIELAYAFEQATKKRVAPPLFPYAAGVDMMRRGLAVAVAVVAFALRRVRRRRRRLAGRSDCRSLPRLQRDTVFWPTAESFKLDKVADGMTEKGYYYAANNFASSEHGGTHIDAPVHFAKGHWASGRDSARAA